MRNILWAVGGGGAAVIAGGFTREDFLNEAFLRMTTAEQVLSLILFSIPSRESFCFKLNFINIYVDFFPLERSIYM